MTILDSDVDAAAQGPIVAIERLLWAGPVTVVTSIAAVLAARLLVIRIPGVRSDSVSLGWIAPTADTAILVTLAVIVFAGITASADQPVRTFRRVAFGALLVSFLPLLIVGRRAPFGNDATAVALAILHVAAYVPCVTLLPKLVTSGAART